MSLEAFLIAFYLLSCIVDTMREREGQERLAYGSESAWRRRVALGGLCFRLCMWPRESARDLTLV